MKIADRITAEELARVRELHQGIEQDSLLDPEPEADA